MAGFGVFSVERTPVLPLQSRYTRGLLRVGRHECHAAPSRLTGEKNIVSADWLSDCFELSADGTRGTRIVFIEQDPLERAGKKGLEPLRVTVLPLALRHAVP
jgi:hypothetical protein